ncbi:General stress protein 16O [Paraliobacillus sp. PM-2]|uniref:TraR/DksA C4-type zinc finger protein n=1 Tax=Paraliobacillus sp. PM-2 TaxID=1462524 RepID=UPI00061C1010|nr:TraR/DksA C4-type zinc finger protein [Paraliobacillus sp. PM-2]CQR46859.1 General stress protein 16O [Paraliobacillus sp. PM-2]
MIREELFIQAKQLLRDRKEKLQKLLSQQASINDMHQEQVDNELSNYDNHPADQGSNLFEIEKDLALQGHMQEELKEVNEALLAIDSGSYGNCRVCGTEIHHKRLMAIPTTKYCMDHA